MSAFALQLNAAKFLKCISKANLPDSSDDKLCSPEMRSGVIIPEPGLPEQAGRCIGVRGTFNALAPTALRVDPGC